MAAYLPEIKALHIIIIISWMAGMLYLPRLFVYHCQAVKDGEADKFFQIMEKRLMRIIIAPAMILTYITGVMLIIATGYGAPGTGKWLHVKVLLVLVLSGIHGLLSRCRKNFAKGENKHSEKFYRIINETITLIMIAIVILVVVKPF